MKSTRVVSSHIACLCLCILLIVNLSAGAALAEEGPVYVVPITARPLERPEYSSLETPEKTVARGANEFAFRFSAALSSEAGEENFICSPYSVWMPLAALVSATKEPQKSELLQALHAAGVREAELNRAASRMLFHLTNQEDREYGEEYAYDPLKIANAIFIRHDLTLRQDFTQAFMDFYRGDSMRVDFSSPEAVREVNRWASERTEGMISKVIQEFSEDTLAVLANAIYFSDRWSWEFSPDETQEGVFHTHSGEHNAFFMLRQGERLRYYEDDKLQAMPLAFKTGGGMLIMLPKDGDAAGLLASMTDELFQRISSVSDERQGKLLLPRFSIASDTIDLVDALKALGIPLLDPDTAPLSGLIEEEIPIWISKASHKAAIEVDEKGTTAAAVTILEMSGAGIPEPAFPQPFEMICDRPFVFVLYSRTLDGGNQVLFTGIVNKP